MLMPASQDQLSRTIAVAPDRHAHVSELRHLKGPLNYGNYDQHEALGYGMDLIIC